MIQQRLAPALFRILGLSIISIVGTTCGQTIYEQCEDEREEARICQILVIQNGVVAAEARRQSQNLQQSDLLIDGLPIAAAALLCEDNISARCDAFFED
jgi:hypothetical protein